MKKHKVTFLLDKTNLWFENTLKNHKSKLPKKYIYKISKNSKTIQNQDIVFAISYTKILPVNFLLKNKLVLVPHPSKLPKDKGFAPVQHQVLKNKKKIFVSLIKAVKKVDAGPICIQNFFNLNGTELSDELRKKQGLAYLRIISDFLKKFPNIKFRDQTGKGNFNKKRIPKDGKLNINKTIKEQFNHLRINDNNLYPSHFYHKSNKYIIKIFKDN
tara:strand:+ start:59 stop:703 length:645 start_codon:yes stop_codon:yes gene_type:complete